MKLAVTRSHVETHQRKRLYEIETCRDRVSRPFLGSYFKLVYKWAHVYFVRIRNCTHISINSEYLRIWEMSEENVHICSIFINFKHFYIQTFSPHWVTFRFHITILVILFRTAFQLQSLSFSKPLYSKSCSKWNYYSSNITLLISTVKYCSKV